MKRKMLSVATVAAAAAAMAMPSAASAQDVSIRAIDMDPIDEAVAIACGPGVVGCVQDVIDYTQLWITWGAETARGGVSTACTIVFGRSC